MTAATFRVTRIDLDDDEEVSAVHAVADNATLDAIRLMTPEGGLDITGRHGQPGEVPGWRIRMPVATVAELFRATGKVRGNEPRYAQTHPVNESLALVYFGLIEDAEGHA